MKRVALSFAFAGILAACGSAAIVDVHIYNFDFGDAAHNHTDPTINLGDTVHWIWDSGSHSTTSALGQTESWNSGVFSPAHTFDHTFTHLGTFGYYCVLHGFDAGGGRGGGMSGSVRVVPEPGSFIALGCGAVALLLRRRRLA